MAIKVSNNAVFLLLGALFVGVSLGAAGAVTAHYFRSGINLISVIFEGPETFTQRFILYNFTLGLAVFIILWLKTISNSKEWQGPADTIYSVHRIDNEINIKLGIFSTLAAFVCSIASIVCGLTPSSAATTSITISVA